MDNILNKSLKLGQVLAENFDTRKYDPRFSIYGVAYFWDETNYIFRDSPENSILAEVIPSILEQQQREGKTVVKPRLYIPKERDTIQHYTLIAMRNIDLVADGFMNIVRDRLGNIRGIVDDTKLLNLSLEDYIRAREQGIIDKEVLLWDFFINYVSNQSFIPTIKPQGQYRFLLERLTFRFDSDNLLEDLATIADPNVYQKAREVHEEAAFNRRIKLNPTLVSLCSTIQQPQSTPNGSSEETTHFGKGLASMLGKRRVRLGKANYGFIDWQEFMEEQVRRRTISNLVNPNEVLFNRYLNNTIIQMVEAYKERGPEVIQEVESKAREASTPEEQKVLYTTLELLQIINSFDPSPRINHTIKIRKTK